MTFDAWIALAFPWLQREDSDYIAMRADWQDP